MKKIMFNDRYGLTDAVLKGRKTMTRRIARFNESERPCQKVRDKCLYCEHYDREDGCKWLLDYSPYKVGEVVAVAQSYKDLGYTKEWVEQHISPNSNANWNDPFEKKYPGWSNKMFVPAELNKAHQIRITDVRVERLQDISDEDCLKEGIIRRDDMINSKMEDVVRYTFENSFVGGVYKTYATPREAFAALINKRGVGGKGTWERNQYVFAYTFEL